MPHFISEIQIKNYKSCINTELKLSPFTALVGYNNAGKSNSLSALLWLIKKSKLIETDFYDNGLPIEVTGKIEGITAAILEQMSNPQRASIEPYINNEVLRIRRLQASPSAAPATISLSVWSDEENDWLPNPNGIDNAIKALLPEPIRIGAMENAADDASKSKTTSTIGKLLATFLDPVKEAHEEELSSHLIEVSKRISADGVNRFGELNTIDDNINEKVENLFPGMSLKLHFNTPSFDDLFKSGTIKVYENTEKGRDFTSYGHGAQRAIQMALVQYLAEVKRASGANQLTTTLLLIDEPELYLHPFAIEQIREALLVLSEHGYQVLISTHSAQMITAKDAEKALLIRKDTDNGTYSRMRLNDAIQEVVPNTAHQMEHIFSLSHSTQVLFSENVVLTEGKTELRLLPIIYKCICGNTMGQDKLSIVPQGGVGSTKKSLLILEAMDLPSKAIVDLDYGLTGAINHGYVEEDDENVIALKSCLEQMSNEGKITLNGNGLPQGGIVTAAKAFDLLAQENDAKDSIVNLHNTLLGNNIWLWKNGAIESHLGIEGKTEQIWSQFKVDTETNGIEQTCDDFQSLNELVEWLRQ